eukprot:CAMPEP_0119479850 /NCGR_PEP_ID=MMETSP1344-20130328/8931_1 /TAXON_ID=236787 /ORGANISM="Florenciella parvula, Strain CCMP2471" /LENGTH=133 /DNA_ID=CAMNT_0007514117 /DNA_START=49 /DNA_END=446 /DNA_ORIENTATION=+
MSTYTSADMSWNRNSSRVSQPPGGGSQISFGGPTPTQEKENFFSGGSAMAPSPSGKSQQQYTSRANATSISFGGPGQAAYQTPAQNVQNGGYQAAPPQQQQQQGGWESQRGGGGAPSQGYQSQRGYDQVAPAP